ncbi:MAG: hypothetical protein JWO10_1257, partial [Microbacteriaceae bacterium]|nr:hypothetical protein [Microbacteriaceae bacterium]
AEAAQIDIDPEATRTEVAGTKIEAPAASEAAPAEAGYDYLFGDTVFRSVEDAAVRPPEEDDEADPAGAVDGDHDGHTVMTSDIAKLRAGRKARGGAAARPAAPAAQKIVLALSTTGTREPLTQPILVGRSPSVSKVSGDQMPRLLTVGGVDQDISRNHARFALEGGTVVVTDLHSRNGTMIVLPGKEPQKLRAGEPTAVILGTVVDLGGGVTFTVDED